eukprot:CAMPEP_0116547882 /NCGR_PEP_ID=MMETSP0397-20121206/4022_1 /TAXON_ID=216820 /ORGANISM="Cyclophora tenuis, Strain ECT3854" /LENGTH=277 /DNA_ID=CAMNT_0004072459 /DNA_START=24 /DNA_END=855 /DNA_ORIENTATION=+
MMENSDENEADRHVVISPSSLSSDDEDHEKMSRDVLNEARFSLRPNEVAPQEKPRKRRERRPVPMDFGDEEDISNAKKSSQGLASTINTIQQRSATKQKKRSRDNAAERLDQPNEDDGELRRGLDMMEAELGRDDSHSEAGDGININDDEGDLGDDFYEQISKRSKAKKEARKVLYAVAPKYPGMEEEVEGERAISRSILKNRGLVAHKAKINRNPRVKKREQYRKALIRRKGKVREVRTDEGHRYGGEQTGIKSGLAAVGSLGYDDIPFNELGLLW